MTTTRPLDWIPEIEATLSSLEQKPQFGLPALFSLQQLEEQLQRALGRADLQLTYSINGWKNADEVLKGLGDKLYSQAIALTPLMTPCFFVTDSQNLKDLMSVLFETEEAGNFFYESEYVQGFFDYFATEMLHALEMQPFLSPLIPRLAAGIEDLQKKIGEEACFVIDLSLEFQEKKFFGRILTTSSFRAEWRKYFAHLAPPELSKEMKEKIKVELALEIGHSRLNYSDLKKIKSGDFIVLDHCLYDPVAHKGALILTLNQKPIFRGRLKEGRIKITNYPIYEEVSDAMEEEPFDKNLESEEQELYDDDLEEESEFDAESELEDEEDIFAGLSPRKERAIAEEKEPTVASQEERPSITPEELPIHLTIEVGRLHMTAAALLNLAPGNLLELNVSPEQGVDLVVNGKKIGRGELIRMGDVLGVRILSL